MAYDTLYSVENVFILIYFKVVNKLTTWKNLNARDLNCSDLVEQLYLNLQLLFYLFI